MFDVVFMADYTSVAIGIRVDFPHDKITTVSFSFLAWSVVVLIGAKIDRGDKK